LSFLAILAKNDENMHFLAYCCELGCYDINYLGFLNSSAAIWQQLLHLDRYGKKFLKKLQIFSKKYQFFEKLVFFGDPPKGAYDYGWYGKFEGFLRSLDTQL
jgi:hypothetical protein